MAKEIFINNPGFHLIDDGSRLQTVIARALSAGEQETGEAVEGAASHVLKAATQIHQSLRSPHHP
jgi:hypothetical protein